VTVEENIRQIMTSKELSNNEKLDQLHALIPPDTFKIDGWSTATPEQVRQLRDGLAVTNAMQEIRRADYSQRNRAKPNCS
jgi:hypothetical protein